MTKSGFWRIPVTETESKMQSEILDIIDNNRHGSDGYISNSTR